MNNCEECGGELIRIYDSEFLVCKNCGLISSIAIFSTTKNKNNDLKIKKRVKPSSTLHTLLKKLGLPEKYNKKIDDEILIKLKEFKEKNNNLSIVRKKAYELIKEKYYKNLDPIYLKAIKEYKNIVKVFLNGNGSDAIFEAIALIYYLKKIQKPISYEKIAKMMNIGKNNLFRRYKIFEKKIKLYEKLSLKKLIILKLLNQPRLKDLTLKEIALIAGVRYDSARAAQMRIKRKLSNSVDEKTLLGYLIGDH